MIFNFSPSLIVSASMLDRNFEGVLDYLIAKSTLYLESNLGLTIDDDLFYEVKQLEITKNPKNFELSNVIDLVKSIELYLESIEELDPNETANQTFKIIGLALLCNGFTEEQNHEPKVMELNAKEAERVRKQKETKAEQLTDNQERILELYNYYKPNYEHKDISSKIMDRTGFSRSTVTNAYKKFSKLSLIKSKLR